MTGDVSRPSHVCLVLPWTHCLRVALKVGQGVVGASPRATTASEGAAAQSFPAHAELRKVAENLSALRMRQARMNQSAYIFYAFVPAVVRVGFA